MSIKKNTIWNLLGSGLPLLVGVSTIPFLIKNIGLEAFGVLTLIWALIGYFSLFDLGLGRALTQQIAEIRSKGDFNNLPALIKTGLSFTMVMGVIGGVGLLIVSHQLAFNWLNISDKLQKSTYHALLIASFGIPFSTVTAGFRGVLEAYEDFKTVNILRFILGIANFGLPALTVAFIDSSLIWMVASLIIARIIILLAHLWAVKKKLPEKWFIAKFEKSKLKKLLSFGAWMTVSNILSPLMVVADRFVISAVLGATVVAYYTVPYEALSRLLILPAALTSAIFPRLALIIEKDPGEADKIYRKSIFFVTVVMSVIGIILIIFSKWGISIWLGEDFSDKSWVVFCILSLGVVFNGIAFVPFTKIQSSGDARSTAFLHIIELVLYIPLLLILLKMFGIIGAAIAWALRVGGDLVALIFMNKLIDKIK